MSSSSSSRSYLNSPMSRMLGRRNMGDGRPPDSGKPIRRALNKCALATAMLSSATPLFLGYDLAVVYSTAVTAEVDLKLLACIVALSSLLGAIAAVGAPRLIGERCTVLLSAATLCAGALARGLAASFPAAFMAGVFVSGVGTGLLLTIVPAYAVELSPTSVRGALASHPDGLLYLGYILGSLCYSSAGVLNLPPHAAWQLTLASSTAVPALLCSAVLLMPVSPRWLVSKDQVSIARRVLARTSATLEEAELRLLEIQDDLSMAGTGSWWMGECGTVWQELLVRPTEPLRRAVVTALVAKIFQQASGIESMLPYVQRAFRDAGVSSGAQVPRALAAFGFVEALSLCASLALVELVWHLVSALAGRCCSRRPSSSHKTSCHSGVGVTTRRQGQLKWTRGLSATTLLSLMAVAWIAQGPARWADASPPRSRPQWLRSAAAAVDEAISSWILSCFVWVYEFSAVYGNLIAFPAVE